MRRLLFILWLDTTELCSERLLEETDGGSLLARAFQVLFPSLPAAQWHHARIVDLPLELHEGRARKGIAILTNNAFIRSAPDLPDEGPPDVSRWRRMACFTRTVLDPIAKAYEQRCKPLEK